MASPIRKSSFVGGEWTPALHARVDLEAYRAALKTCRNMIVVPQGGVKNRPGTRLVTETKNSGRVMLLPFIFNQDEAYVIEAGEGYFRFVRNASGQILTTAFAEIASNDQLNPGGSQWLVPGVLGNLRAQSFMTPAVPSTIGAVDIRVGRADGVPPHSLRVEIWSDSGGLPNSPITGLGAANFTGPAAADLPSSTTPAFSRFVTDTPIQFQPSTPLHIVVAAINNSWVTGMPYVFVLSTNLDNYPSGQCRVFDGANWLPISGSDLCFRALAPDSSLVEIATPYTIAEAQEIKGRTAQSADVMFIPHHSHPPKELKRYSQTNWVLSDLVQSPGSVAPLPVTVSGDAVGGTFNPTRTWWYVATAINTDTGAESFGSLPVQVNFNISSVNPATVTIAAVPGSSGYNIYRGRNSGIYGYVGTTNGTTFFDDGISPDYTVCPIQDPNYKPVPDPVTPTPAAPTITPTNIGFQGQPQTWFWEVAAVGSDESFGSAPTSAFLFLGIHFPDANAHNANIDWPSVPGAASYRIFRGSDLLNLGLIGTSPTNTFLDQGNAPDFNTRPKVKEPFAAPGGTPITFDAPGKYPSCAAFFDQRLIFGGTDTKPDTIFGSRTGNYRNFGAASPAGDDDGFEFTVASLTFDRIKGMLHSRVLMTFTAASEYVVQGTKDGVLGPSSPDIKAHAHFGSGDLAPLAVGGRVLFMQREGQAIREFRFDYQQDGYTAEDERSVLANHLIQGHEILDWAYAKGPDSVVWVVRDDGVLLGMTYLPQHDVIAWHRHDTDGFVESVACIPEGDDTGVYISVLRQSDGVDKRFIERFAERQVAEMAEAIFLDCSLTYRSPDFTGRVLTFQFANSWLVDGQAEAHLTGDPYFESIHIDTQLVMFVGAVEYRATIIDVAANGLVAEVRFERDFPVELQGDITEFTHAIKTFLFPHIVNRSVSALVDGNVVSDLTVDSNGIVELPVCGSVVTVGLPYTSEIETLDINVDGRSLQTVQKVTGKVWFKVRSSRGLWAGEDRSRMREWRQRKVADGAVNAGDPVPLATVRDSISISGGWGNSGSVILQQRDPLPVEILSVTPEVVFGG